MEAVVTGANRGLGLALARRLAEEGALVHATARVPEDAAELRALARTHEVRLHQLDVTDDLECDALRDVLTERRIDLLVNNAGIDSGFIPFEESDFDEAMHIYDVDAVGPLRVTCALREPLIRAHGVVLNVSSRLASIARNEGLSVPYRMAKAALNMMTRTLAVELRARRVAVVAVSPGWVRTDMGGPEAPLSVDESTRKLAALAPRLSMEHTGRFLDLDGRDIPW
ncbi:MAG TPA: SDR family oxidoreductase [Sandaracinaceae bacterium LLY-WYZ-13_1]|nr:SDR family oxidoreductase [Sandaracinaceae bacterium LLY-WYZ-13_1]